MKENGVYREQRALCASSRTKELLIVSRKQMSKDKNYKRFAKCASLDPAEEEEEEEEVSH